ncbi:hypothetical protein ACFYTF_10275 [Nocardia thailandica]|uniref:DUF8020 domain-containing protein n=1 Tax=Nocardia thailandica TaxID=257275 RepID=A0ABW6PLI0_9NOCA
MTAPQLTPIVKKVDLSDLNVVQLAAGSHQGIAYAVGHTPDRTGVVVRLADGVFSLNRLGTKVLVTDDDGDVIDKWPLTLKIRGKAVTLTPKIAEEGHKLKLTVATIDGKPAPAPRPAGTAAGEAVILRSPESDNDVRSLIQTTGFAVGAILGALLGTIAAFPTFGAAGPATITGGFIGGGVAGTAVGAIVADALLPS